MTVVKIKDIVIGHRMRDSKPRAQPCLHTKGFSNPCERKSLFLNEQYFCIKCRSKLVYFGREQAKVSIQSILDEYESGIQLTQVQTQQADPPDQVIDAFRDVQAARADMERSKNEAQAYACLLYTSDAADE